MEMDLISVSIGIKLAKNENEALNALKRRGIQKNHWIAQAIREKLAREKLLSQGSQKK